VSSASTLGEESRQPQRLIPLVLTGDTAGAEPWAAVLDAATFEGAPLDGSASFESARAIVRAAMYASGPEAAGRLERALATAIGLLGT
jgi:hypothetical protein